jgi:Uma2 family endonuclease
MTRAAERRTRPSEPQVELLELPDYYVQVRIPAAAGTLNGFREWAQSDDFPERGFVGLINGNIVIDMSPDEIETHIQVHFAIAKRLSAIVEESDVGDYFPEGVLLTNSRAKLSTVPDGTLIKWSTLESGAVRLIQRKRRPGQYIEIRGTPDLVLEVVSQSSVQKDTVEMPVQYHRAGIPEFWLVDARGEEIDFRILTRRPKKYVRTRVTGGWSYSPTFERRFRLTRRPNRGGLQNYRLESKTN